MRVAMVQKAPVSCCLRNGCSGGCCATITMLGLNRFYSNNKGTAKKIIKVVTIVSCWRCNLRNSDASVFYVMTPEVVVHMFTLFVGLELVAGMVWEKNTVDRLVARSWCWNDVKEKYYWLVGGAKQQTEWKIRLHPRDKDRRQIPRARLRRND